MPWGKSFDEDVAIEKAMDVFWEKGFESASIADLLKGTGLNKGSLYNAFGGKQQLFLKALSKYDQKRREILARVEAMDDPRKAIVTFLDEIVVTTVNDQDRKGCFLFNTALEIATHDDDVNAIVTNGIREIEAFFRRSIEVGQVRSEISEELEPGPTAKALLALVVSIRVLGRGIFTEPALRTIADQGKQMIGINLDSHS